jgi:hypothetical protein
MFAGWGCEVDEGAVEGAFMGLLGEVGSSGEALFEELSHRPQRDFLILSAKPELSSDVVIL